jgi:hypothetical protein
MLLLMWFFMKMKCIILPSSLHFKGRIEIKCRLVSSFGKISNYKGDNLKTSCEYPRDSDIMDNKSDCSDGQHMLENKNQDQIDVQDQIKVSSVS